MKTLKTVGALAAAALVLAGIALPTLLFFVLVLSSPSDVLTTNPELKALCDAVQHTLVARFPEIDFFRHARSTRFPEVATLATAYASVWWLWMTVATAILLSANHKAVRAGYRETGAKSIAGMVFVAPPFGLFCLFSFFALPGDPSLAPGLTTDGRLGYAFMGGLAVCFASIPIGALPVTLVSLFADVIFTGGKKRPKYLR
ncbi:MAG: hypothetical protein GXC94_14575 [Comamonadaceae bacterium]|jgi:hypothetical protein|nr:hypothetical protein [Comamonadaceae bacterium]